MRFRLNATKRRFLLQYALCALIPIIAMLIMYAQAEQVIFTNAYEANEQMLRQNIRIVENGIQEIKRTASYLLLDQSIVSFLRTENPIVNKKTVTYVITAQKTLTSMMNSNNLIKNISVYAVENDMLISSETSYIRMPNYYYDTASGGMQNEVMWREDQFRAQYDGEMCYSRLRGETQLVYAQSYPMNRTAALEGNLVICLDTERVLNCFSTSADEERCDVFIADADNQLILSNATDERYQAEISTLLAQNVDRRTLSANGRDVLLSDITSPYLGWRYISARPVKYVLEEVERIRLTLILFMAGAALLAFGVAATLALRSARPITRMIELVSQHTTVDEIRNDSEFLQRTIRDMIDSNRSIKAEMARSIPAQRISLFYRLLSGEFESESGIRDEFARIGVTFSSKLYAVLIMAINDVKPDAPSDEVIRLKLLLDEAARETLDGILVEYDMDLEKQALILAGDYDSPAEFIEYIESAAQSIYERMRGTVSMSVSFAGDICLSVAHIHNCYLCSKQALNYKEKPDGRLVLWYHPPGEDRLPRDKRAPKESPEENNRGIQRIEDIRAYLRDNYTDCTISLAGVAERFGITEVYLSRMFKERTGINFSKEVERLRMERAHFLLETTDLPIGKVSELSGYTTPQVFRRVYHRVYGVNPSEQERNNS